MPQIAWSVSLPTCGPFHWRIFTCNSGFIKRFKKNSCPAWQINVLFVHIKAYHDQIMYWSLQSWLVWEQNKMSIKYKQWLNKRPILQIPECICVIPHNATFYNSVHISVTKWCILGDLSDELRDLWHVSIISVLIFLSEECKLHQQPPKENATPSVH